MFQPNQLAKQAGETALASIPIKWKKLQGKLKQAKDSQIDSVNIAFEIGVTFQEICGHNQMRLSFFENIKAKLPRGLNYNAAKGCIHLANTLPGPVKTLEDASRAMQSVFQAGGFLEIAHRSEPQQSHAVTPVIAFYNAFTTCKEQIRKQIGGRRIEDEDVKNGIREQIKAQREWLDKVEAEL